MTRPSNQLSPLTLRPWREAAAQRFATSSGSPAAAGAGGSDPVQQSWGTCNGHWWWTSTGGPAPPREDSLPGGSPAPRRRGRRQKEAPTPGGGPPAEVPPPTWKPLTASLHASSSASSSRAPLRPRWPRTNPLDAWGRAVTGVWATRPHCPGLPVPARGRSTSPWCARMAAQQPGSSPSHSPRAAAKSTRQAGPRWAWAGVGRGRGRLLEGPPPNARGGAARCKPRRSSRLPTSRLTLPPPSSPSAPPPTERRAHARPRPPRWHGSVPFTPPHAAGSSGGESLDRARADRGLGLRAWATRAPSLGADPRPCRAAP